MKRKFITLFVVALVVAGIIVVNRFEPQRLAQAHYDAQQKTAESIEAADAAEAESEGLVGKEYMANLETQVDAQKQIIAANVEEAKDYLVTFDCSNGEIVLEVSAALAPLGAAQFRKAIEDGVYDGAKFFRVIPGFMAQFGISGDPKKAAKWEKLMIKDDPVKASNTRGTMSFATAGPNTRTTQLFINFGDNSNLDDMKFGKSVV